MQQANRQQVNRALAHIGLAVLEAAQDCGDVGAPGGIIYAAMQSQGFSLNQYQTFMRGLATLSYGQTKLVTVKVHGEDSAYECEFVPVSAASRKSQQDRINQFCLLRSAIALTGYEKRDSVSRVLNKEQLAETIFRFASISKEVHAHQMNAF